MTNFCTCIFCGGISLSRYVYSHSFYRFSVAEIVTFVVKGFEFGNTCDGRGHFQNITEEMLQRIFLLYYGRNSFCMVLFTFEGNGIIGSEFIVVYPRM